MRRVKPAVNKLPDGDQLLELYKLQFEMADRSLAVERDITVKNFAAFGAVIVAQGGFILASLRPHVVFIACGLVLGLISIGARAMSIIYGKYSKRLYILADITLTIYLKGKDGSKIRKRRRQAAGLPDATAPNVANALEMLSNFPKQEEDKEGQLEEVEQLPNADTLSWRELLCYPGALSRINAIPLLAASAMFIFGIVLSCTVSEPFEFINTTQAKTTPPSN